MLDQIVSSAVADANITANGSGALTAVSETLTGAGTALTVSHNALVSGILTTTGNHVANGGMNINSVRDNSSGNLALDLSAGTGEVKFPVGVKGIIKSVGGGHTLQDFNFGLASNVNNAGVTITHGIKNASGTSVQPTAILATLFNAGLTESAMADTVTSTTFRLTTSTSSTRNVWWLALLA